MSDTLEIDAYLTKINEAHGGRPMHKD